jgi:hypothetical protein
MSKPNQTCYRYVQSRHVLIISRIAYNSYPQIITIRYFLQQGSLCTLTGFAEAIVNAEVPPSVASFIAYATLIPLDKLDPEQRRAQ